MSFINPIYLFAASAALIPVLIHLIRKMRAKRIRFSSLLFLRATPKELIKRRRLRDIILLLARVMLLLLLAIAFSRPFIPREKIPFVNPDLNSSTVILLDNSYSMRYGEMFERMQSRAMELIDEASGDDEIALVMFDENARQVTHFSDENIVHRSFIERFSEPGYRTTQFYNAFRLAEEILKQGKNPEKRVILLSDLQDNGWGTQFEDWNLEAEITVVAEKLSDEVHQNSFVSDVRINHGQSDSERIAGYSTKVENSYTTQNKIDVSLEINESIIETKSTSIDKDFLVSFRQRGLSQGLYRGSVNIEDPKAGGMHIDDVRYFSYRVDPLPAILCYENIRNADLSGDSFYLRNAFDLGESSMYGFNVNPYRNLRSSELNQAHVVMLLGVPALTDNQITDLNSYVTNGGSLIISFGPQSTSTTATVLLNRFNAGKAFAKVRVSSRSGRDAIIGDFDEHHPIFSLFAEVGSNDIFRPKFREFMAVDPDSSTKVLASYDTGEPFMLERAVGRGKVLIITSTFGNGWTDLPVHEFFIPFVYQTAAYAAFRPNNRTAFTVGESVTLLGAPGDIWEIETPRGEQFKVDIDSEGASIFAETEVPGNYIAVNGSERYAFSVNLNMSESDLKYRDAEEAVAFAEAPAEILDSNIKTLAGIDLTEQEKEQKLWRIIVIMILMLFLFETWYAVRTENKRI